MAAIAAVSVAALGLMGLTFVDLPDAAPVAPGDALKIEIVAPVEPTLVPGSVMDVGELVDGFRYVPPRRAERPVYEAAWVEDEEPAPYQPPMRNADVRRYASEGYAPPPPRRERERWFGFENPLPDFAGERRARQARLDAIEDQRRAEREARADRRRYSSGPERYSEPPRYSEAPRYSEPPRYEPRRDDRRNYDPPRYEPRADEVGDGPYGPEVG